MDFETLKKFKPHIPLIVIERDLSQNPEIRQSTTFRDEDLKIDFTSKRLERGEIEIPVFTDSLIRPFFFKGKLVRYEKDILGGGFFHFVFYHGKMQPQKKDRRYYEEDIDRKNGGMVEFWIGYHHEKKHYYHIETEETFKEKYAAVEHALMADEVQDLLAQFEAFISDFFSTSYKVTRQQANRINGNLKVNYVYEILNDLNQYLPMLKDYHLLLNIMDDIDDTTYLHITNRFNAYQSKINVYLDMITNQFDKNKLVRDLGTDYKIFEPIDFMIAMIETNFLARGYHFDTEKKDAFPNFMEVHLRRQLSDGPFESVETLELKRQEFIASQLKKNNQTSD